ncbi:MAG: hypothetical protein AB7V26_06430 [Lysobacterales bacterium]
MTANASNPNPDRIAPHTERWGSWEDAEHWRRESFLRRTPAQRMKWLEEMLALARRGAALRNRTDK